MITYHPTGVTPQDDEADLRQLAVARLHKKRRLPDHHLAAHQSRWLLLADVPTVRLGYRGRLPHLGCLRTGGTGGEPHSAGNETPRTPLTAATRRKAGRP